MPRTVSMTSAPTFRRTAATWTSTTFDPGSNVVEVYVGYLRRKLGAAHIETVRGMGYRLRAT